MSLPVSVTIGAPLTAPGRSEETLSDKRERKIRKPMTPASKHLAHARAIRLEAPAQRQGAGCRDFSRLPARGEAFSLDILFYRTRVAERIRSGESIASPSEFRTSKSSVNTTHRLAGGSAHPGFRFSGRKAAPARDQRCDVTGAVRRWTCEVAVSLKASLRVGGSCPETVPP